MGKENMMLKEHMGKLQMESMGRVLMERMEKEKKCKYLSNSSEILHIYFKLDSIFCCEPSRPMQVQFSLRAHYMTFYDFWILRTFLDLGGIFLGFLFLKMVLESAQDRQTMEQH